MIVRLLPLLAAFLMWAAFAPIGLGPLVFPAIFCWLVLVAWPGQLPKHSYKLLYMGSFLAWLALLQGIRLAYWPLYAGWVALSFYVAFYIPLFVFISRFLIYRWRWPLAIAAPIVWAGCELLRCYVMTGFGGCLLSHTMAKHPIAIQLASHLGPHLLSGLYVFIAATALDFCRTNPRLSAQLWPGNDGIEPFAAALNRTPTAGANSAQSSIIDAPIVPANRSITKLELTLQSSLIVLAIVASILLYAQGARLEAHAKAPLLKAGLIQENAETRFDQFSEEIATTAIDRYRDLTSQAARQNPDFDLVVWPESVYTLLNIFFEWDGKQLPNNYADYISNHRTAHEDAKNIQRMAILEVQRLQMLAGGGLTLTESGERKMPTNRPALMLGALKHSVKYTGFKPYNSVIFQPKDAGPLETYDKRKLVMFGEYIPFAQKWPEIYKTLRMDPLSVGKKWMAFKVDDVTIAPSICFEDMLPQAMQEQVSVLKRNGTNPDVLVNVTNDAWFRGSSMLDHHFACAIFTAVENRRPMLIAANTGVSGWISGNGTILAESEKMEAAIVVAQPTADGRWGLWQSVGDWPARACAGVIVLAMLAMIWRSQVKSYYDRRNESAANAQS